MMEKNKYEIQYDNLKLLDTKMYDYLFPQRIRANASLLIVGNNLQLFREIEKNTYEAIAPGTYDYMVRVLLNDDLSLKNCSCECAYYNNTDHHCKHIYALLNKIITEKNNIIIQKKYDENIAKLGEELEKLSKIIEQNEISDVFLSNWINSIHKRIEEDYRNSKGINLTGMRENDAHTILNHSLSLVDNAKQDIKKVKDDLRKNYENEKDKSYTIATSVTIDESPLFDEGGNHKSQEVQKKMRGSFFSGFFSNLFKSSSDYNKEKKSNLMSWEMEEVNKGKYEDYQFEEEELEDDDYYKDDLD